MAYDPPPACPFKSSARPTPKIETHELGCLCWRCQRMREREAAALRGAIDLSGLRAGL